MAEETMQNEDEIVLRGMSSSDIAEAVRVGRMTAEFAGAVLLERAGNKLRRKKLKEAAGAGESLDGE